jgi:hypothetical protein
VTLILSSTSDKIQLVTGQAVTAIDVHADWIDNASGTITPGRTNTASITTATTTDVVASPGASTQRNVKALYIRNRDGSLSCDVTVKHTDGTNNLELVKATVGAGETLEFTEATGFFKPTFTGATYKNAFLTTPTSISAATYADVGEATLSLEAGTWEVHGQIFGSAVNLAFLMNCAITDGANNVQSEGSQFVPASGTASVNAWGCVSLRAVVIPTSTTTYKLRAARGLTTLTNTWTAQDGSGTNVTNNASTGTDKGTGIWAFRVK